MANKISESPDINSVQFKDQAADPSAPSAGYVQVYTKSGVLYGENSAGTVSTLANPGGANPTGTAGPTAVNGTATTFMRSDGAPAVQAASTSVAGIVQLATDGDTSGSHAVVGSDSRLAGSTLSTVKVALFAQVFG